MLIACGLAFATVDARAVVIIGNLDDSLDTVVASEIGRSAAKGMGFTMPAGFDYLLDSVTLLLHTRDTRAEPIVEIWSSVAGQPDSPLITLDGPIPPLDSTPQLYDFTPATSFTLVADTIYWLVVHAADPVPSFDWLGELPGVEPTGIATHFGQLYGSGPPPTGSSDVLSGYVINGTPVPVPEPSSVLLIISGLVAAARLQRWRRHGL